MATRVARTTNSPTAAVYTVTGSAGTSLVVINDRHHQKLKRLVLKDIDGRIVRRTPYSIVIVRNNVSARRRTTRPVTATAPISRSWAANISATHGPSSPRVTSRIARTGNTALENNGKSEPVTICSPHETYAASVQMVHGTNDGLSPAPVTGTTPVRDTTTQKLGQ